MVNLFNNNAKESANYLLRYTFSYIIYPIIVIFLLFFNFKIFAAPNIAFDSLDKELIYNWGKVTPDKEILSAKIPVKNFGDDTLKIFDIHPGCSCTMASIDKNNIPPGDSAILNIALNTRGFKGNVSKGVNLKTNAPGGENIFILLQTYITYPIAFIPNEFLIFFNTEAGIKQTQKIQIQNTTDTTITIEELRASEPSIEFDTKANTKIKPGEIFDFSVSFTAKDNSDFRGLIIFKTDYKQYQFNRIHIRGIPKKEKTK